MVGSSRHGLVLALLALVATGCEVRGVIGSNQSIDGDGGVVDGTAGADAASADDDGVTSADDRADEAPGETTDSDAGEDDAVFDVGSPDAGALCGAPLTVVCEDDDDPWHAIGINCGGFDADVTHGGDPRSLTVHAGHLGSSGIYAPRQGERMLILSTGDAKDMARTPAQLFADNPDCQPYTCPSQRLAPPDQSPRTVLPEPMTHRRVDAVRDCTDDPTLVGMGDCSNTLFAEFKPDPGALDYAELRIATEVPLGADALAFEFAFFTAEYPLFVDEIHQESVFNDMFIAWLQSERWTGNVSFDKAGHPVSINSVLLDYRDASTEGCMGCTAPELAGFAAENHAGTDWLRTVAPVTPGESIELIIAVMDQFDGVFDSAILLDGFEWTCTDLPPLTLPAG